ncbi:MAG: hypothetical protein HKM04_03280 [Legionellales bacterium]|nr:hypothetical protein [Legionellales bacterium]
MSLEQKLKNPPRAMLTLYGESEAPNVIKRCYEVNPFFGEWACDKVYGELWEREPLTMLEKSLITVVSLAVLGKEEQLTIHLKGLLHLGKNIKFIEQLVLCLMSEKFISSDEKILSLISKSFKKPESNNEQDKLGLMPEETLFEHDKIIIRITAVATLGNNANTETLLKEICLNNLLSSEEISAIFLHLMIYCGCPVTMNACSILNNVLAEREIMLAAKENLLYSAAYSEATRK